MCYLNSPAYYGINLKDQNTKYLANNKVEKEVFLNPRG